MPDGLAIGIDIGGTKVAAGVVDEEGGVVARAQAPTPGTSATQVEDTIAGLIAQLTSDREASAVGIGAAGFVDDRGANVLFSPHLAWRHEPLRDAVAARTGLAVTVDNDANAAAWAEWRFGAGRGEPGLVCVNLGTGIGGGIVSGGGVYRGRFGLAGEFGHMQVVPDGRRCECGNRGCWEQYASGNALVREARELVAAGSPTTQSLLERAGGDPSAIDGPLITDAARGGDPMAVELFGDIGRWLGVGIANLAAALDPGMFVIGGGVSAAAELLIGPARDSFRRSLTGRGFRPEATLVAARLGNDAGLVGAADLARLAVREPR